MSSDAQAPAGCKVEPVDVGWNCWELDGLDVRFYIERRPTYCDRGNFKVLAEIKPGGNPLRLNLDHQDGFPRYYFDWDRMVLELEAWMIKRGQMPDGHDQEG